jgi:hypothetical protein
MKKWLFCLAVCGHLAVQAQEAFKPHYINMTEFGGLFGRVMPETPDWNGGTARTVTNRLNFTMQTFNGVQLKPRLTVGATVGIDWYNTALLMPLAVGARYDLAKNKTKKSGLFASFDAGYATNWLHADGTGYQTKGGLMFNPGLGLKIGLRGGSALLLSLTYKRQQVEVQNPLGWGEISNYEERVYNRMAFRLGVSF